MESRQVFRILLISLVAVAIVLGVQVAPSSAGGAKEGGGGSSDSHLMGPAIFGTITLTATLNPSLAQLHFQGVCKGQEVSINLEWPIFVNDFSEFNEKCTDEITTNCWEGSYYQDLGSSPELTAIDCSPSPNVVLQTVTKYVEILDTDPQKIIAQGIFLFDVPR